jgi:ribonuclease HI
MFRRTTLVTCIKALLGETKAAGKHDQIQWIAAHREITENEKADELAKPPGTGGIAKSPFQPKT